MTLANAAKLGPLIEKSENLQLCHANLVINHGQKDSTLLYWID